MNASGWQGCISESFVVYSVFPGCEPEVACVFDGVDAQSSKGLVDGRFGLSKIGACVAGLLW